MALKFQTRRLFSSIFNVIGRDPFDYAREFQDWIEAVTRLITGAIPAGFNDVEPTTVDGVTPASPGEELQGWASATHQHALDITGVPGLVGAESLQGDGPGVSLSGHTHAVDWDALVAEGTLTEIIDERIEETVKVPVDLRHYRRRKFLGLVDDNRLKGAVVGARRVFP